MTTRNAFFLDGINAWKRYFILSEFFFVFFFEAGGVFRRASRHQRSARQVLALLWSSYPIRYGYQEVQHYQAYRWYLIWNSPKVREQPSGRQTLRRPIYTITFLVKRSTRLSRSPSRTQLGLDMPPRLLSFNTGLLFTFLYGGWAKAAFVGVSIITRVWACSLIFFNFQSEGNCTATGWEWVSSSNLWWVIFTHWVSYRHSILQARRHVKVCCCFIEDIQR